MENKGHSLCPFKVDQKVKTFDDMPFRGVVKEIKDFDCRVETENGSWMWLNWNELDADNDRPEDDA